MTLKVPAFPVPGLSDFLSRVEIDREKALSSVLSATTANRSVLLYSPSKKVYEIKVSDTGAITATLVAG